MEVALSRSGYSEDCENDWSLICWRGAVASAIKGRRGQAFLREMLAALDALEPKRLITEDLVKAGEVCALGAVGAARKLDMSHLDPYDRETVANVFNVAAALAAEIAYINDDEGPQQETPEARFTRVRAWVVSELRG